MKNKFIKFLKENHAWEEFKEEMKERDRLSIQRGLGADKTYLQSAFDFLEDCRLYDCVLEVGLLFFHDIAITNIDWDNLHEQWVQKCKEQPMQNDTTEEHY